MEDVFGCTGMNNCKRINTEEFSPCAKSIPVPEKPAAGFVIFGLVFIFVLIFKNLR